MTPPNEESHELASLQNQDQSNVTDSETAAAHTDHYPSGKHFHLILLSAILSLIIAGIDSSIISVAIPSITDHFHTVSDVGWYSAAYRLCLCSFQFMFGKLYRIFPLKAMFLTSNVILIIGVIVCAAAPTSATFVIGRAISGFANAGILAGCFAILVSCLPLRSRPLFASILGSIEGMAAISSPIMGGAIIEKLGWRWCFWILIPLGGFTLLCLIFCLPNAENYEKPTLRQTIARIDLLGNMLFVPALTSLFLALSWGGTRYSWESPTIIGLFSAFGLLFGLFALDQWKKADDATLPPRILRNRSVLAGFIFSLCCNSAMNMIEYYLPAYFQVVHGFTPSKSGYLMLPLVLGFILASLIQGSGVSILGYYTPFMLAGSILMPVFAGLLTTLTIDSTVVRMLAYGGFYGFAGGIGFQAPQTAVQTSLPDADANLGLAVILFAQQFGAAVFISAAQSIFSNRLADNLDGLTPGLNATTIRTMGLSDLKDQVESKHLREVLRACDKSIIQTWYLAVILACITVIGSVSMEWRSVKHKVA